ncbi:MAG: hypothetical protein EBR28_13295 [Planctomycetia bacterium]|nr:hypothetical protein [Planctomycetia bacterium]
MLKTIAETARPPILAGIRGLIVAGCWMVAAAAADTPPATASPPLASREQELAAQFRELERTFLRLADLLATSDPRRAALLRSVFEQARDQEVGERLDVIVKLLEQGQLLKAGTSQATAIEKLQVLLGLLEAGDTDRLRATAKEEVKKFLSRVAKAIAKQRDIEGSTEAGSDTAKVAARQEKLAEETEALARDIGGFARRMDGRSGSQGQPPEGPGSEQQGSPQRSTEPRNTERQGETPQAPQDGEPSQGGDAGGAEGPESGQPAADEAGEKPVAGDDEASRATRTQQRLEAARRRMQRARERLDEAQRREARAEQERAVEELETARAELEEILRQLREEEVEKLLVQLEARLRGMLRAQRAVLAGAEKLAPDSPGSRPDTDRERQLEAARLGREESAIGADAAKALVLVRDDGSAVAIPEALEQVRDDATQAAARLGRGDAGDTTRGLLQDIVANLEEMLAALEKAQRDQQSPPQGKQGSGGRPAEPGEQPLVDKLSELKMIRSLQLRVNTRTKRFAQLLTDGVERADEPELVRAIERLAERQHTIERAAHDIVSGRAE